MVMASSLLRFVRSVVHFPLARAYRSRLAIEDNDDDADEDDVTEIAPSRTNASRLSLSLWHIQIAVRPVASSHH